MAPADSSNQPGPSLPNNSRTQQGSTVPPISTIVQLSGMHPAPTTSGSIYGPNVHSLLKNNPQQIPPHQHQHAQHSAVAPSMAQSLQTTTSGTPQPSHLINLNFQNITRLRKTTIVTSTYMYIHNNLRVLKWLLINFLLGSCLCARPRLHLFLFKFPVGLRWKTAQTRPKRCFRPFNKGCLPLTPKPLHLLLLYLNRLRHVPNLVPLP